MLLVVLILSIRFKLEQRNSAQRGWKLQTVPQLYCKPAHIPFSQQWFPFRLRASPVRALGWNSTSTSGVSISKSVMGNFLSQFVIGFFFFYKSHLHEWGLTSVISACCLWGRSELTYLPAWLGTLILWSLLFLLTIFFAQINQFPKLDAT